jgi:hypothetical protein
MKTYRLKLLKIANEEKGVALQSSYTIFKTGRNTLAYTTSQSTGIT